MFAFAPYPRWLSHRGAMPNSVSLICALSVYGFAQTSGFLLGRLDTTVTQS